MSCQWVLVNKVTTLGCFTLNILNSILRFDVVKSKIRRLSTLLNQAKSTSWFSCSRESCTHDKQQQCVLVGTVKRIWLCEPERKHTLKHREQKKIGLLNSSLIFFFNSHSRTQTD
jgi:hypothetical protein